MGVLRGSEGVPKTKLMLCWNSASAMNSSPPVISLQPLRDGVLGEATRRKVDQIEASFRTFGCVCIPLSDLDNGKEVRGALHASATQARRELRSHIRQISSTAKSCNSAPSVLPPPLGLLQTFCY